MNRTRRLTLTVSGHVFQYLETQSTTEGRSLSNLAAFLLECAVHNRLRTAPAGTTSKSLDYLGSRRPY